MQNISFFVIEDHSLTNLGIRECIEKGTGFVCAGFASSESEAFEKLTELSLRSSLPSLIVLDLFLNGDSGLDILREVVRHFPSINVVVYSMYSNPGIVNALIESGAKGFVSKASNESVLVEAVKKVSAGERYIQETLVEPLKTYKNLLDGLTKTERFMLQKLIERVSDEELCTSLELPPHSFDSYLSRIYAKTGCRTKAELISQFG